MKLSIIVPVYNVEQYIEKCINSILSIKVEDFEIIIIDDCGNDNSILIAQKILEDQGNIKFKLIRHKKNAGLATARNTGLSVAEGEYIYFLDSDDYIDSQRFSSLFTLGYSSNSDIFLGDFFFDKENEIKPNTKLSEQAFSCNGSQFLQNYYRKSGSIVWRYFYKKAFLNQNNLKFKEIRLQEDIEFSPRAIYLATKISYYPIYFYFYRIRQGSLMGSYTQKRFDDNLSICQSLYAFTNKCKNQADKKNFLDLANSNFLTNIAKYMKNNRLNEQEEKIVKNFLKRMIPTKPKIWILKFCSIISYTLFIKIVIKYKPNKNHFRL